MNLKNQIESAEHKLRQRLEDFFSENYDDKSLPSHGIDHHRRVWAYSKELLLLLQKHHALRELQLPFNLIIASYMHDIGMAVEPGIMHGRYSRDMCIHFLVKNHLPPEEYKDALEAIENHDNKEYCGSVDGYSLKQILAVADDLDAFGFTGIYRYSEIYLTREISADRMGHLIRKNAATRFNNFENSYLCFCEFFNKHRARYAILDNFFLEYNNSAPSYRFGTANPSGYCGVIDIMCDMANNKTELEQFIRNVEGRSSDPVIKWYFKGLASELS